MTMLRTAVRFFVWDPVKASKSLSSNFLYNCFCIFDIPTITMVSVLGGRPFATSALSRRSINGRRILCSWLIIFFLESSSSISKLNHSSNWSAEEKISGNKKLSNAHNSCRLFWRGVPVSSKRFAVEKLRTVVLNMLASFLRRCASSIIRYFHANFWRVFFSVLHISYVVTQTSHWRGLSELSSTSSPCSSMICLSGRLPS
mmetsp:Transcript_12033/g.28132  ORF Transcript_12033/g.28132 Transcript_12033/m.28132 type:complete len:201 (-) Transcript_12033:1709-2311(-)